MNFRSLRTFALGGVLAFAAAANAQSVLDPVPASPLLPSSLRAASKASPFALPGPVVGGASLLQWGPLALKPSLSDKFVYSAGIQAAPGHPANSYINTLTGGMLLDIGSHWTANYTPTWTIYTSRAFQNSLDHAVNVAGGGEFGDWLAQFSQAYSSTNTPLIETGRQTGQETSGTTLGLSHRFSDHWSFDLQGAQNLQFIDASPDNYDWSIQGRLAYRYGTRLDLSFSYRLGFTDFDPGAYMTYAQPSVEARWRVADKLTLSIQGGRERRQLHKTGIPGENTPTWNLSAEYQPFEHTTLTVGATRAVSASAFTNGVSDNQGWTVELGQRLFGRLMFNASLSRQKNHFSGTHPTFIPQFGQEDVLDEDGNVIGTTTTVTFLPSTVIDLRNDSTRTSHLGLSLPVMKHGTISVLYDETRSTSDAAGFSFTSHQIGGAVGYQW